MSKLSASAISAFLKSPKGYYYGYVRRIEPLSPSVGTFDHDKLVGILWAEFVDRFYRGVGEDPNTIKMLADWRDKTEGWVPETTRKRLQDAMTAWANHYHQAFSPDDGVRNGSEKLVENERFIGYLDGLSHDGVIHEVKSTSRSPQLSEQLNKVQQSVQVKLYAVLAKAKGVVIEFAFKDSPYGIYRAPVLEITEAQRQGWEQELNALADSIYALGDDEHNYPCHPDGCTIISKNFVGTCQYQALCMGIEGADIAFKNREHRKR